MIIFHLLARVVVLPIFPKFTLTASLKYALKNAVMDMPQSNKRGYLNPQIQILLNK